MPEDQIASLGSELETTSGRAGRGEMSETAFCAVSFLIIGAGVWIAVVAFGVVLGAMHVTN